MKFIPVNLFTSLTRSLYLVVLFFSSQHAFAIDKALQAQTTNLNYQVTIEHPSDDIAINTFHLWVIAVTDQQQRPVDNLVLAFNGGMPDHAHGLPTEPKVIQALGKGKYLVGGIKFNMPGEWQFNVHIKTNDPIGSNSMGNNLIDTAAFELTL